ncbi:putative secreted protein [Xanthomonas citri pv. punicae str. LMG 859]|nr:putative secreted protein [Xanthomonas citri pv. punicae str. LMG 859]
MVALRASAEQTLRGNGHAAPPRTLLVLVANADGGFVEVVRNTRVIFKADEGGQCDPFRTATRAWSRRARISPCKTEWRADNTGPTASPFVTTATAALSCSTSV